MKTLMTQRRTHCGGFTLVELLFASSISLIIVAATLTSFIYVAKAWRSIDQRMQADRDMNSALNQMIYGVETRRGLRAAREMTLDSSGQNWTLTYVTGRSPQLTNSFTYSATGKTLVFNPGNRLVAKELSAAQIALQDNVVNVTLRVDRVSGNMRIQRAVGTQVVGRN